MPPNGNHEGSSFLGALTLAVFINFAIFADHLCPRLPPKLSCLEKGACPNSRRIPSSRRLRCSPARNVAIFASGCLTEDIIKKLCDLSARELVVESIYSYCLFERSCWRSGGIQQKLFYISSTGLKSKSAIVMGHLWLDILKMSSIGQLIWEALMDELLSIGMSSAKQAGILLADLGLPYEVPMFFLRFVNCSRCSFSKRTTLSMGRTAECLAFLHGIME